METQNQTQRATEISEIPTTRFYKMGRKRINMEFSTGIEIFSDRAGADNFAEYDKKTHHIKIEKYIVDGFAIYKIFSRRKRRT